MRDLEAKLNETMSYIKDLELDRKELEDHVE